MKRYQADCVFPISSPPINNGIVTVSDDGKILKVEAANGQGYDDVIKLKGIITPGFVNSHCHLELSFMKDQMIERSGLKEFVKKVVAIRDTFPEAVQQEAIDKAETQMMEEGIVAVGDISNDDRSFLQKSKGNLRYHTFIEVFDLGPANTLKAFDTGKKLFKKVPYVNGASASLTPHAPYSCTNELYWLTDKFTGRYGSLLSIHNQENPDENRLFQEKKGMWVDLFKDWDIDFSWFQATGENSMQSMLKELKFTPKVMNIHNTFTQKDDIQWAKDHHQDVYWCFCPNANLYIEDTLPDFDLFLDEGVKCVVGTDSLASNHQLSILEELKVIQKNAKKVTLDNLLAWATLNGAEVLDFDEDLGSIEKGKTPGLNLIENVNVETGKLTARSRVKKLV